MEKIKEQLFEELKKKWNVRLCTFNTPPEWELSVDVGDEEEYFLCFKDGTIAEMHNEILSEYEDFNPSDYYDEWTGPYSVEYDRGYLSRREWLDIQSDFLDAADNIQAMLEEVVELFAEYEKRSS